jgi:hypothetical protein
MLSSVPQHGSLKLPRKSMRFDEHFPSFGRLAADVGVRMPLNRSLAASRTPQFGDAAAAPCPPPSAKRSASG